MQFYSLKFVLFFILLLLAYYKLAGKKGWVCLLCGSLLFYASFHISYLCYIAGVAITVWGGALLMQKTVLSFRRELAEQKPDREKRTVMKKKMQRKKRALLFLVLILNFGTLAFFKYAGALCGFRGLLMPLGLSFYMFQAVSYLIDIYYEKYEPERNPFHFLLFVSWFPQLVQGPIGRYDRLAPQLLGKNEFNADMAARGLLRILYGAMKKFALANLLAGTVSYIFDNDVTNLSSQVTVIGILFYAVQQYADFSGGIDMVIGISALFGVTMDENFKRPYFSVSIADFWRRWHITLGAWMRDYVFYPFALQKPVQRFGKALKKRFGKHIGQAVPASIANLLVFFLVGIWHGSELHFLIWGLYNGVLIAVSDLLRPLFEKLNVLLHIRTESRGFHAFRVVRTFILVLIGCYFDRIESVRDALICLKNTVLHISGGFSTIPVLFEARFSGAKIAQPIIAFCALVILIICSVLQEKGRDVYLDMQKMKRGYRWLICIFMMILILAGFSYTNSGGGFMYAVF